MEIRQYRDSDLKDIIQIWEAASAVGHPFLSKTFLESEKKNIPARYLPNGDAWVAVYEGRLAGFMILHGNEVGALFVKPDLHGLGLGYSLMNKANELHKQLKVEVFKENLIGLPFYSRFGFKLLDEYFHDETGMIMLVLEKKDLK